jgi:hypothetical protein
LADGLDFRSYKIAVAKVDGAIAEVDRQVAEVPVLVRQVGFRRLMGSHLTEDERREYVRSVVGRVVVDKAVAKGQVAAERVQIEWRA